MANPRSKKPFIAAILSFLIPGLGQIYKRERELGIVMFFLSLVSMRFYQLAALVWIASIWDAYTGKISDVFYRARKEKEQELDERC
ncbi:hypothetical protein ACFLQI_03410 [Candidatus Undinarchaeota archaeon]